MTGKPLEFYNDESVVSEGFQKGIDEEIERVPHDAAEINERIILNTSSSPADSGGDIDAAWEEVDSSGSESVFGHNPTPDQSDVEKNAHAMGIDFQDNEPLDFVEKIERRDRDRFEMDESSKNSGDSI